MTQNHQPEQVESLADVLESTTLLACPSQNQKSKAKNKGLIAKIPVVIAEPKIQINVESTIRLETAALEIKRIRKNLTLTQCELIPTDDKKVGKLFLSGFVRKNIEYATAVTVTAGAVSGDIRHTTVNVPFQCFAKVDFIETPEFEPNENAVEVEIFDENSMSSDRSESNFIQAERFNEGVFCELVEARFREKDIILNPRAVSPQFPNVTVFNTFVEKMVIDVTVKILQNQQVEIPKVQKDEDDKDGKDGKDGKDNKCGREGQRGREERNEWMGNNRQRNNWREKDEWEMNRGYRRAACSPD